MRTIRALTIATAFVAALPSLVAAQHGRQFSDAWFWGVKGGGFTFIDSGSAVRGAPMVGVDWLITRTNGGLYVSAGQAFFTARTRTLRDPNFPVDSGNRVIDLKNMRRLDIAIMGFPGQHLRVHPYVGIGFSLNQIPSAEAAGPFGNADQQSYANAVIQNQKVAFSPMVIAGVQKRMSWASIFGQFSMMPANKNFLLYNGHPLTFLTEFGFRYNVGSSIDRQ